MELDRARGGHNGTEGDPVIIGIITVSDRASSGTYQDESGPAIIKVRAECCRMSLV
jgi:molybdopterin biosynthesis enzyme MoaB